MFQRRKTRVVSVGNVKIGGTAPITVQSMLNIRADDTAGNVKQAIELHKAGCQIIRIAVPNMASVKNIAALKETINIPIVADIHFDYRLAIESVAAGADKIRINPGNIGADDRVKAVAQACREKSVPIRIGVNSGSVEKEILAREGGATPSAMVQSALYHISLLEKFDFKDIVLSLKASDVIRTVKACELIAEKCDYPLHLGVTEAGTQRMGLIKSSAGIGSLLIHGIGDTIRVSITDDPVREVEAGNDILKGIGLLKNSPEIISCPTCGRTDIDLIALANEAERRLRDVKRYIKVAIMGCAVNGPGEAADADIGIAGGKGEGLIFKKGKIIKKVPQTELINELMKEIENL